MSPPARSRTSLCVPHAARRASRRVPRVLVLLALLAAWPASAQWPGTPATNLPVCTAPGAQYFRNAVSDGAGGLIVAWSDERADTSDVYVQRVSAAGVPLWTAQGVRICGAYWEQDEVTLVEDGRGGAYVAWRDNRRRGDADIYAQRVDADGSALWTADGVPVCTATGDQVLPTLVHEGVAGVIVVWEDRRVTGEIYAQQLTEFGTRMWTATGVPLSSAAPPRFGPVAATDGVGGAIVAWTQQGANGYDVVAQRIADTGEILWGAAGLAIGAGPGDQLAPAITAGALYRVFIAWEDDAGSGSVIRVQGLDITGASHFVDPTGLAVGLPLREARRPAIVGDGSGGAIVTWHETLVGAQDVRAQRVSASGLRQWVLGGEVVSAAPGVQQFPTLVSDGRGGALFAWEDLRSGAWDIYAQRLDEHGVARWGPNGMAVSNAVSSQLGPRIVGTADTLGTVLWTDQRTGGTDLYAQRIPFAVTLDAPSPPLPGLALAASPNPAGTQATLEFTLAEPVHVSLTLHDAAGRRVRALWNAAAVVGAHRVVWDGRDDAGRLLPPGLYLARLRAGAREGRITLVRTR